MLGGAFAVMRKLLFLGWLVGTPTLVTAQNLLGVTGGGRSALYWGLLGCAESNFAFCINPSSRAFPPRGSA